MELVEHLEHSLEVGARLLKLILEVVSALCVSTGLIATLRLAISRAQHPRLTPSIELRSTFGTWLALALEFQLGADILATTISPSFDALGKLAIIALVRTFLNYFLNRELQEEAELQRKLREPTPSSKIEQRY